MSAYVLPSYQTYVFDCDGVILDSNPIKSDGFEYAAKPFADAGATEAFVDYHKANGGVSRYRKFDYFIREILHLTTGVETIKDSLLERYADYLSRTMQECAISPGFLDFVSALPKDSTKFVCSGGDERELQGLFAKRGLDRHLNGVFGSPRTKYQILQQAIDDGLMAYPGIFFGDSRYDYVVASDFKMDFIFMTGWTEFEGHEEFFKDKSIRSVPNFRALQSGQTS